MRSENTTGLITTADRARSAGVCKEAVRVWIKTGRLVPDARLLGGAVWFTDDAHGRRRRRALAAGDATLGLLTADALLDLLGINEHVNNRMTILRGLVRAGQLPPAAGKVGRFWCWDAEEVRCHVRAFAAKRRQELLEEVASLDVQLATAV